MTGRRRQCLQHLASAKEPWRFAVMPIALVLLGYLWTVDAVEFAGRTCSLSENGVCDENYTSDVWADRKLVLYEMIANSWGVPQKVYDFQGTKPRELLEQMETYMTTTALTMEQLSFCKNYNENCTRWAFEGECEKNRGYMSMDCGAICLRCHELPTSNNSKSSSVVQTDVAENGKVNFRDRLAEALATADFENIGVEHELTRSGTSTLATSDEQKARDGQFISIAWGEAQQVTAEYEEDIKRIISEMDDYMINEVAVQEKYAKIAGICKARHDMCASWTAEGECKANPSWMQVHCAPTCKTCEMLDYSVRCPIDDDTPVALAPGDLNRLFERIMTDPHFQQYSPSILSSPDTSGGPWVIQLDTFATDNECETLIEYGKRSGYGDSITVGKQNPDGSVEKVTSNYRTSTTAWCENECANDPMTKSLQNRIANLTGVPVDNSEQIQLLKYDSEQFYKRHHDYLDHHRDQPQGPRILTLYMYLNNVHLGGGTAFPDLNLTVWPKRGRAMLWPSVLNEDPFSKDGRTDHEALAVQEGIKFGANAWLHQRDYQAAHNAGCT